MQKLYILKVYVRRNDSREIKVQTRYFKLEYSRG